jgi:hypothetical protein
MPMGGAIADGGGGSDGSKSWTSCRPGQYVSAEATALADRQCAPCPAGSYSDVENAAGCLPWLTCDGWGQSEATAGTPTSDRVCKVSDGIRGTGTDGDDIGTGIAVDNQGNVVIVGYTNDALAGVPLGGYDAFVRKLDSRGEVAWTRQFGNARDDQASGVAVDADGGVFVVGSTGGSLAGTSETKVDAFVRKYDPDGALVWFRQFGTADWDRAYAVAVDAKGNAYVAGSASSVSLEQRPFLRKYGPNGDLVQIYELALPSNTSVHAVAVDASGSVYLAGSSDQPLEGPQAGDLDAVLMKLDAEGYLIWTRQYGSSDADEACALAIDRGGNPWMAGYQNAQSSGSSPRSGDGFVRRYDPYGTLIFSYSIEDSRWGGANAVALDSGGHGFVIGTREYSDSAGSSVSHAYLDELDAEGSLLGRRPIEGSSQVLASGVATSASGRVYILVNACSSPFGGHRVEGRCDTFVVQVR